MLGGVFTISVALGMVLAACLHASGGSAGLPDGLGIAAAWGLLMLASVAMAATRPGAPLADRLARRNRGGPLRRRPGAART